jgi:hypothetical protein
MGLLRWWPWLRTSAIATPLGITVVGMCQFAFSDTYRHGLCSPLASPWVRLCFWLRSGRQEPLLDLLSPSELERLAWTAGSSVLLGVVLVLSIGRQRPIRYRLHLRDMMIAVAILACAWLGGREVWSMWKRWDDCHMAVEYCSLMEVAMRAPEPSDPPKYSYMLHAEAENYSQAKRKYQHAMWRPWVDMEPLDIRSP